MLPDDETIAIVLFSPGIGGTERRIGNLYKFLSRRNPSKYHLIINRKLYDTLQRANYHLEAYPNIHIVSHKSRFDIKDGAHAGTFIQLCRVLTLLKYRHALKKIIRKEKITTIQVFLEMVPFLGVLPIRNVKKIASLVSHLPKYYDKNNFNCRLLLFALRRYDKIDALYTFIADNLRKLEVVKRKINYPRRNFVNHIQFRPEKKEKVVTFTARMYDFKNPLLFLDCISEALPSIDDDIKFYILGKGPLLNRLQAEVTRRNLGKRVVTGFWHDPSRIVNKSIIHISIEQYDNATNQSLLEGMAAGCAIITNTAGLTGKVVTSDTGICVEASVNAMAGALIQLLNDPDVVEKMGHNSRKKILSDHGIDMYIDYITKIHDAGGKTHLINGKEVPAISCL